MNPSAAATPTDPATGQVNIVRADLADVAALAPALAALPLMAAYGQDAERLCATLQRAVTGGEDVWVAARHSGAPLGLAWFAPRGGFGLAGYLRLLAVKPHAANLGLGSALLGHFETQCRDARGGQMVLCSAKNTAALRFYLRAGYGQVGELAGFVHPAHTELLLHKPKSP